MTFPRTRTLYIWAALALAGAALSACGAQSVSPDTDGGDAHVGSDATGNRDVAANDVVVSDARSDGGEGFDVREGDGGVCPPYSAVLQGAACDAPGATCWGHDPTCNDPGVTQCTCSGGAWECNTTACRDAGACPDPAQVHSGGSCLGDNWCASSDPVRDCDGNVVGTLECHCEGGAWYCPQTGMYCPPPDAGNVCEFGAACTPGQSCVIDGPCGAYCSCDSTGHYICEGPPCLPDAGACPDPSQVQPGATCGSPGTDCAGPTVNCPGYEPFTVNCSCDYTGHWSCPAVDCPAPPPDAGPCPAELYPGGPCNVDGQYCPGPTVQCGDAGIQVQCTCSGGAWVCPVVDCF